MNETNYLRLDVSKAGLKLDADLNGFKFSVAGSLEALLPYLSLVWGEVRKTLPNGKGVGA